MKTRGVVERQIYVEKRNNEETIKRRAKNEVWEKIGNDLRRDMQGTKKLLYNMAKNYRKGNNQSTYAVKDRTGTELLVEPEMIAARWREYFEELLNEETEVLAQEGMQERRQNDENGNQDEITMEEINTAVKKMKNGKSPGDDELPIEIFKVAGEQ